MVVLSGLGSRRTHPVGVEGATRARSVSFPPSSIPAYIDRLSMKLIVCLQRAATERVAATERGMFALTIQYMTWSQQQTMKVIDIASALGVSMYLVSCMAWVMPGAESQRSGPFRFMGANARGHAFEIQPGSDRSRLFAW